MRKAVGSNPTSSNMFFFNLQHIFVNSRLSEQFIISRLSVPVRNFNVLLHSFFVGLVSKGAIDFAARLNCHTLACRIVSTAEPRPLPCPPLGAPTAFYAPGIWECFWAFTSLLYYRIAQITRLNLALDTHAGPLLVSPPHTSLQGGKKLKPTHSVARAAEANVLKSPPSLRAGSSRHSGIEFWRSE